MHVILYIETVADVEIKYTRPEESADIALAFCPGNWRDALLLPSRKLTDSPEISRNRTRHRWAEKICFRALQLLL